MRRHLTVARLRLQERHDEVPLRAIAGSRYAPSSTPVDDTLMGACVLENESTNSPRTVSSHLRLNVRSWRERAAEGTTTIPVDNRS